MAEPWQPLLSGAEAARALDLVRAIAADPTDPVPSGTASDDADDPEPPTASLAGGHAGLAVFQAHVARAIGSESTERLSEHLDASDDALAEVELPPTLFDGFTGIGWANAHIERLIADEAADLAEIDAVVLQQLSRRWEGPYELMHGLTGLGVYALERLPSPAADRMVALTIQRLRERAITEGPRLTWFTPTTHLPAYTAARHFPRGHVNLGLAHGVPGVVAFLGAASLAGHAAAARPLLDGVVPWLLAQRLGGNSPGLYPQWIAPGVEPTPSRLGWCYGDTGVASALLLASQGTGRDDWRTAALAVARRAAARSFETSGVQDAMLCHGAAGVAHLFNRMFQATGEGWLADAARRWFAQALQMQRPGTGIAGFQRRAGGDDASSDGWRTDPGLLTGTAGLALALLAAATEIEPEWDRALLLSARHLAR